MFSKTKSAMKIFCKISIVTAFLALLIAGLYSLYIYYNRQIETEPVIVEVEVVDTIYVDRTRIVEHTVPIEVKETDTLYIKDTIFVLPITSYEYRDTIVTDSSRTELDIKYSGYKASLDEININYQSTKEIVLNQRKRGSSLFVGPSIHLGYGIQYDQIHKTIGVGPEVSVGIAIGFSFHK